MSDSDHASNPTTARPTLRLKGAPRRPAPEAKAPSPPKPISKASQKPGARWSDEYIDRMQADMDALTSR